MKKYRFNSLKLRLVLLMACIIFAFSLVLIIYMRIDVKKMIKNDTYESVYANQDEVENNISSSLINITSLFFTITGNDDFNNLFEANISDRNDLFQDAIKDISSYNTNNIEIILWYDNTYYVNNNNIKNYGLKDNYFISKVLTNPSPTNIVEGGILTDSKNKDYIVFGKKYLTNKNKEACLFFCLDEEVISDYLSLITGDLGYTVLVSNDLIISHPEKRIINTITTDLEKSITTYENKEMTVLVKSLTDINTKNKFDWKFITYLDNVKMFNAVDQFILYDSIIISLSVLIGIIIALIISSWLVTPINHLIKKLREFSKTGEKPNESSDETLFSDDIIELDKAFNEMMDHISNLIKANNIEQENKRELELYALQIQINPHFLYNTLDAIAWIAKLKKEPDIEKLVLALARFFRISLHKGDRIITVEEEVELIRNYCIIELTKVPDQFVIEYQIAEEVKKLNTLKLILQPIVENAIKHGIATKEEKGHILVKAYKDETYIYYEVIDDGEGFIVPSDMLEHEEVKVTSGYGLKNVDERIKLEYGNDCGIQIESTPGKGTTVTVRFKNR